MTIVLTENRLRQVRGAPWTAWQERHLPPDELSEAPREIDPELEALAAQKEREDSMREERTDLERYALAREGFREAIIVVEEDPLLAAQQTREILMSSGKRPIIGATFATPENIPFVARIPVIKPIEYGYEAISVSAGTKLEDRTQKGALNADARRGQRYHTRILGLGALAAQMITRGKILYVNRDYVLNGAIDPHALFKEIDVSEQVQQSFPELSAEVKQARALLRGMHPPQGTIEERLAQERFPVTNLAKFGKAHLGALLDRGVYSLADVPLDAEGINPVHQIQIRAAQNALAGKADFWLDRPRMNAFLDNIVYPIISWDIETYTFSVPAFQGTRSGNWVVFQYSMRIQHEDGRVEQRDFLHKDTTNPNEAMLAQLFQDLPEKGTVLVWSNYEDWHLSDLAQMHPEYDAQIQQMRSRIVDLETPFVLTRPAQLPLFYNPEQGGRSSIKVVGKLFGCDGYENQEIHDGLMASSEWFRATHTPLDEFTKARIYKGLTTYCQEDVREPLDIHSALVLMSDR
jgi:hypothetical protein